MSTKLTNVSLRHVTLPVSFEGKLTSDTAVDTWLFVSVAHSKASRGSHDMRVRLSVSTAKATARPSVRITELSIALAPFKHGGLRKCHNDGEGERSLVHLSLRKF